MQPGGVRAATLLAAMVLVTSCGGRSAMDPPDCLLSVSPFAIDFGEVASGQAASRPIALANVGRARCQLAGLGLTSDSDSWFRLDGQPADRGIEPGEEISIGVVFRPGPPAAPLRRMGEVAADLVSTPGGHVSVLLAGSVHSECALEVAPPVVDFGVVGLGETVTKEVVLTNSGRTDCSVDQVALDAGSDSQFSVARGLSDLSRIAPGATVRIPVAFTATDGQEPHHRTGALGFTTIDARRPSVSVPLSADIEVGCDLAWYPLSVDFGSVIFGNTVSADLTLRNDGITACEVDRLRISDDSDPAFALAPGQESALALAQGESRTIHLTFTATSGNAPYLHTGAVSFSRGDRRRTTAARVPLVGTVSTACASETSRWFYVWYINGVVARFDPATLTFKNIALVACKDEYAPPISMAVDQESNAWVLFGQGRFYKVDLSTGRCEPTKFQVSQHNITVFGMSFVFDPKTGTDTLYIAGGWTVLGKSSTLATISFPSLEVNPLGTVTAGSPELTGTGDGELWGFIPQNASSSGHGVLVRLDPKTGATLESHSYPMLDGRTGGWAMKFWGGDFWIFLDTTVYRVRRSDLDHIEAVSSDLDRPSIVGAGVSSCAPLK